MASTSFARAPLATRASFGRAADIRASRRCATALLATRTSPPPGLAFSSDAAVIDPNDASAVASREGDEGYAERLREVFAAHEGVVVGAFARVDGDGNGDEPTVLERRFPGLSLVQMGFDLLAGDGDVEGKTLIGYARAATDGSMVATVDEVVVDRKFRNRGVGRRLLSKLGDELRLREIYDVGARVPDVSRNFFRQCGFAPDPEDSVLMALPEEVAENTFARDFDPARRLKRGGEGVRERMLKEMEKKSPSRL